jgi:putative peptidoglycan lipid II flippase
MSEQATPVASASLARGAATITIATAASRVTGFLRVVVVAATMGTTFLANTYQTANTAPNLIFELAAAGVLTSVFVPTFVDYVTRGERKAGWDAANALTSVALVVLVALAAAVAVAAPWVMRLLTVGVANETLRNREIALGSLFLRLFAPQIIFYGAGMVMTAALHAHRRFGIAAAAPIFNNVVVIAVYLTYAAMRHGRAPSVNGITSAETYVLGVGTTVGVVAMTVCLIPQLARLGWRWRWRFDPSHPAVEKAARLGMWALGYAGGYQAGLVVVLVLANRVRGGVAGYQWAYTLFYVPHALVAVPIFSVLFPAMAEHASRRENSRFVGRLQDGLDMLVFMLAPLAGLMFAAAAPIARLTLSYGAMTSAGTALVAHVIAAFALGLPAYSAFLVFTRAFYALGDTKTPAIVNAATVGLASALGAVLFFLLDGTSQVAGLALGHSVGFTFGVLVLGALLARRVGTTEKMLTRSAVRSLVVGGGALAAMIAAGAILPDASRIEALLDLSITAAAGGAGYVGYMAWARAPELAALKALAGRS